MAIRTEYEQGQFAWVDLTARDMATARQFYQKLFGWESVDIDTPGGIPMRIFNWRAGGLQGWGK